ncbi:MAG TPA: metallophosphoesterase [Ilumatobacteraceae bacterium]|nr:metallophosphoesterase [Ilumatobacteraceae bacterium]
MAYVIAQLSDVHVGGPHAGSGERFSEAIAEINAMRRQPDLVLLTGDNTHNSTDAEWDEFTLRLAALNAPWEAINGNHDRTISAAAGHRVLDAGPLRLVLVDSSRDEFTTDDAAWLDAELAARPDDVTVIAIHHPPFETGIWWMDCVGLEGADLFEQVVRRHRQVIKVLSGHVHRTIQTNWDGCSLWVSPSTSVAVAGDLHPDHDPAETAEPPAFSLHAYTGRGIVSHVVPVGMSATRTPIEPHAAEFVNRARSIQRDRDSLFK